MERPLIGPANQRRALGAAVDHVTQARAALLVATDPGIIAVLKARVDHPTENLSQIAARLGMTKDTYWPRLRRALANPTSTTRPAPAPPEPVRAGQPSPRSANAIRVRLGRPRP